MTNNLRKTPFLYQICCRLGTKPLGLSLTFLRPVIKLLLHTK